MENYNKALVHLLVEIKLSFGLEAAPLEQKFIPISLIGGEPHFHYFNNTSESPVITDRFLIIRQ